MKSIFSHLAASESSEHTAFTHTQAALFEENSKELSALYPRAPLRHLLNSSGIVRFPEYQYDMVRLGIGLYGISGN